MSTMPRWSPQQLLDVLAEPFTIAGQELYVRASIGIAHGRAAAASDQLLRDADLAMYATKHSGKNGYRTFEAGTQFDALDKLELGSALRRAFDRDEIFVQYQPIIDLVTGQVVGAEALARWNHPERGPIGPDTFIPLAEENGLIVELGDRVLLTACKQVRAWQLEHRPHTPLSISVNVSPVQLIQPDFVDRVAFVLEQSGLAASSLVLEITETTLMRDTDRCILTLCALRALGVRIAIDDFGTGYSSLSYLHQLPVDILKIDRSFVAAIDTGTADRSLAPAIVSLGRRARPRRRRRRRRDRAPGRHAPRCRMRARAGLLLRETLGPGRDGAAARRPGAGHTRSHAQSLTRRYRRSPAGWLEDELGSGVRDDEVLLARRLFGVPGDGFGAEHLDECEVLGVGAGERGRDLGRRRVGACARPPRHRRGACTA